MKQNQSMLREVVKLSYPSVLEYSFVALASMVDTYMVSNLGSDAVAAVGLTTQPKFIGVTIFLTLSIAVSTLVARRWGQKDRRSANSIAASAIGFCVLAGILVGLLYCFFADQIIAFCGSEPQTHDMAVDYLKIVMGGIVFSGLTLVVNAALRGCGNTKIAMYTNVVSNLVNVVGNYLLIEGRFGFPALGVQGAAIATVFGTVVGCVMCVVSLMKSDNFVGLSYIFKEKVKPSLESFRSLWKVGYSVLIEQVFMKTGFLITALMAADMGTKAMAAYQVAANLSTMSFSMQEGMQVAVVTLIGRSLGEEQPKKARKYGNICLAIGLASAAIMGLIYFIFGRNIMGIFFKEKDIIDIGTGIVRILAVVLLSQACAVIFTGCLRGAGDMAYTAVISVVSASLVRTIASYLFAYPLGLGINGVWLGILTDQTFRFLLSCRRYRKGKWEKIKI